MQQDQDVHVNYAAKCQRRFDNTVVAKILIC